MDLWDLTLVCGLYPVLASHVVKKLDVVSAAVYCERVCVALL